MPALSSKLSDPSIHTALRKASMQDAKALATLGYDTFVETFGHLYKPDDLQVYLAASFNEKTIASQLANPAIEHWVAREGDTLIGYAKLGECKLPITLLDPALELHRLYVRNTHQGRGIGRALLLKALTHAKHQGVHNLYLSVWEHNHKAQQFYKSFGFQEVGEYPFYVGSHVDRELIYRKAL